MKLNVFSIFSSTLINFKIHVYIFVYVKINVFDPIMWESVL